MSYFTMDQLSGLRGLGGNGLGQVAQVVAGVVQPLAQGGADIFRTYTEGKQSRKELKQREREFAALQDLYGDQLQAQERQQALGAVLAMRRAQISGAYQASYAPYLLGAVAIGGLALVAIATMKGGKRAG